MDASLTYKYIEEDTYVKHVQLKLSKYNRN